MNQILGIIDTLEALILEGRRIPLSEKVILNEKQLLTLIDKIRVLVKSEGKAAREAVDKTPSVMPKMKKTSEHAKEPDINVAKEASKKAQIIKEGAHEYADQILANLQLTVTKLQKNLVKLENNIQHGRSMIEDKNGAKTP